MRIAYISGPLRARRDNGNANPYLPWEMWNNLIMSQRVAREYWLKGFAVICPHANTMFMDGAESDNPDFIKGDLEFISRMKSGDIIVMLPGWERSDGARIEKKAAENQGIYVEIWEED